MASKKVTRKKLGNQRVEKLYRKVCLKKGDTVMVIAGGNSKKRPVIGKTGKILRFAGDKGDRVVVEGLNFMTHHQKQTRPEEQAGKIQKEGSIHISNVMFYAEKLKKPVRLKAKVTEAGKKVRGYLDPQTKEFVQV